MIIYFHGFNSGGSSAKALALRNLFSPDPVLAPTYPAHQVTEALVLLRSYVRQAQKQYPDDHQLMLVGSSLGALYARALAPEFGASMVLINPAMHPDEDLLACVGENHNPATGETYVLTEEHVRMLASLRSEECDSRVPTLVLLDEGDELLDYRVAARFFAGCGKVVVFPHGSHRFEHLVEAEADIRRLYLSGHI